MATTDIAKRVYDHTWKLDPIIRSLLDTDFYKLLMLQMIWGLYRDVDATFSLYNRARQVRIADEIDAAELRDQLDHARTLRFTKKEMIWLAGNTFYGRSQIFDPEFLAWLHDFQLPEYGLRAEDGQYVLEFSGPWTHTSMWEIPALAIISEPRSRGWAASSSMSSTLAPRRSCGPRWSGSRACRTCGFPISARAGATVSYGSDGASRPSRRDWALPSSARATCSSPWTTTSRR